MGHRDVVVFIVGNICFHVSYGRCKIGSGWACHKFFLPLQRTGIFPSIIKEANEFFAHYRVDAGRPPIEAILFYQEDIMPLLSLDHVAFNENLRKKGSYRCSS